MSLMTTTMVCSMSLLVVMWSFADETEPARLVPEIARLALVDYMKTHPNCFAGYTSHLKEDASRVVLSNDGRSALIGRIHIDLTSGIYQFERWVDDLGANGGTHLVWQGEITMSADGSVAVSQPLATEEAYSDE